MDNAKSNAPRPEEGILDELDDALADSFPASDPPAQSVPKSQPAPDAPAREQPGR